MHELTDLDGLMRNDFVTVTGTIDFPSIDKYGIPFTERVKVAEIREDCIITTDGEKFALSQISATPLTDEYLQDSYFEKFTMGEVVTLFRQKDDEYAVELYDIELRRRCDSTRYSLTITYHQDSYAHLVKSVRYVHELQHALRECNLSDIANYLNIRTKSI